MSVFYKTYFGLVIYGRHISLSLRPP